MNFKLQQKLRNIRKEVYQNNHTITYIKHNPLMKVEAYVINQEIRMKVKKVLVDLNKYRIVNIPVWYCYNCNVLLHNKPSLSPCH